MIITLPMNEGIVSKSYIYIVILRGNYINVCINTYINININMKYGLMGRRH